MKVLTIISDFITQYIPDFRENVVEYLLLGILVLVVIKIIKG